MPPSDASPSAWHGLRLSRRPKLNLPPLFYQVTTTTSAPRTSTATLFTLHMTDLITLYTASLSQADILAEADRQHSPIDPSENAKQLAVLLDYLTQSLGATNNLLVRHSPSSEPDTKLTLQTTTPLPAPLRPLVFAFTLAPQAPTCFSRTLLLPALRASQLAGQKFEALLEVVRDKDHVIAKLLERVGSQASGDMSLVFPTLTGKRGRGGEKVGVKEAGKWVRGLDAFELVGWEREKGFGADDEGEGGLEALVRKGGEKGVSSGANEQDEAWVARLPGVEVLDEEASGARLSRQVTRETTREGEMDDDQTESEDEFERQATPPSARKGAPTTKERDEKDAISSSEEEREASAKGQESTRTPAKRSGKLGGLGRGRRTAPEPAAASRSSSIEPPPKQQRRRKKTRTPSPSFPGRERRQSKDSAATATESEDEPRVSHVPRGRTSLSPQTKATRSRAQSTSSSSSDSRPKRQAASSTTTPNKKKVNRLGRIGRKTRTPSADPVSMRENASRSVSPAAQEQPQNQDTPSHRLGKLGLRKKGGTASPSPAKPKARASKEPNPEPTADADDTATESEDNDDLDAPAQPKTRSKGPGSGAPSAPAANDRPSPMDTSPPAAKRKEKVDEPDPEAETMEQAAARRREELKRTAARAPAKKKRRF